ncbi:MAG: TonB family protein [Pseudomonadota bacterium]
MRLTPLLAAGFLFSASATLAASKYDDEIHVTTIKTTTQEREAMRKNGQSVILKRGVPIYPSRLLKHDPQGCVNLAYDILPDGKTANYEVLKSVPPKMFDKVAIRSVEVTEFEPQAAKSRISQIVTFSIVPMPKGKTPEADLIRAQLHARCIIEPPKKKKLGTKQL